MVLVLCTTPESALYFYQVSGKYLKGFQNYWEDTISKGNNSVEMLVEL